jgi:hypothetical protein
LESCDFDLRFGKFGQKYTMVDFHMNQAYNKGAIPKNVKKVSNFQDHTKNFYSDKTVHFYNKGFHAIYSKILTLQRDRTLFLISVVFWK